MTRWKARHLLLSLVAVLIFGLSLRANPGAVQARTSGAARGTIIIDFQNDFSSLDTGRCYDTQCYPFMHAMYNQLVTYDSRRGNGDTLIPDAAAAMPKVSGNRKIYTFRLRRDVRFWNGKLATSSDWVYSFERIIDPTTQAGAASFWMNITGADAYAKGKAKHVSGIRALGKWGLRIALRKPDASFLNVLAMPFGSVVDQAQIRKYGKSYASLHPMGTGPYMFKQHVLGQRLILVRNPRYFRKGVGRVAAIDAEIGKSVNTSFLRIQRGQADLNGDNPPIPPAEFLSVINDPKWKPQLTRQVQVATWYISMNTLIKPFTNVLVRRAVNYAINKPLLVRLINGRAVVTNTFLPPSMPGHGTFNLYPYNPAKGRQLLKKAGYPRGFSTTFYSDNISDDPRIAQAIIPMLAAIGIKANLKVVDGNTWQRLVGTKGKVPITWSQWYMDFPDPNDFFEPIQSCASAVPGTFNESWYCDPKLDRFAQRLKSMPNGPKRLGLYPKLDRMMMADAPVVPVMNPVYYSIHSFALRNFYFHNVWGFVFQDYTKR